MANTVPLRQALGWKVRFGLDELAGTEAVSFGRDDERALRVLVAELKASRTDQGSG